MQTPATYGTAAPTSSNPPSSSSLPLFLSQTLRGSSSLSPSMHLFLRLLHVPAKRRRFWGCTVVEKGKGSAFLVSPRTIPLSNIISHFSLLILFLGLVRRLYGSFWRFLTVTRRLTARIGELFLLPFKLRRPLPFSGEFPAAASLTGVGTDELK